ncbi:MAG TPA: ATP-binding protein [Candidatus Bathyarchaeia archaeon]|nr:ATP-binding protein [Candidatus Bathyarchaeia archaeon]
MTSVAGSEKTEVVYGTSNVLNAEIQFFSNARLKVDTCMDYTRPSLTLGIESIRKSLLDAKGRGVKLRYITEITTENISYCKELMKIADVRHLDGIKGNFMVSEKEYLAPAASNDTSNIASQIIYSNLHVIVEHEQYIFETLWTKAIPAEQRIREIEDGVQPASTRILKDQDQIINELRRFNNRATKLSICSAFGGMQMTYKYLFDTFLGIVEKYKKGEGEGMRWIINIDKDNLDLVKVFLKSGIQIRHIKNMPPMNFGVSDVQMAATIEKMEYGKISQSFLISTEPFYIQHFNSLFDEIWKNGVDAKVRIADIEEGADLVDIEVIPSAASARELYLDALKEAQKDIIIFFPTTNAFLRQHDMGVVRLVKEAAEYRNVRIRILMPRHELTEQIACSLTEGTYSKYNNIDLRYIKQTRLNTHVTILIVDEKVSLVMEIRDDSKGTFDEAIGLSIYSNSRAGVLSYISIFENLWLQTELYDQIKESSMRLEQANEQLIAHDKMQKEFINIAAHELKTPIQPILGITQLLWSQTKDVKQQELLEITIRNAKRLQRLSNDILDVAKIEGRSLELNKEDFKLNDVVINAINDLTLSRDFLKKESVSLSYNPDRDVFVNADKGRISQVISNLLNNAIEFTGEGTILVSVEKNKISKDNEIIVSVKDTGQGIDQSILPRLFTKFASKSYKGTGLGLFISKGIIEAHGGNIWGENNPDGRGAKFSFSLLTG